MNLNRRSNRPATGTFSLWAILATMLATAGSVSFGGSGERPEWVQVADDGKSFVLKPSGKRFTPWGFNYDHDEKGRLIEDYWETEWAKVEEDFGEMKALGANVVRVHLQLARFMETEERPNKKALRQLRRLVGLAERLSLYLDLTGLGCYYKKGVPAWYDALTEERRWAAQARFWEAVAQECKDSPAVFFYDLMNEPVVPGGKRKPGEWLGPPFAGGERGHFVQFITLDQAGRPRPTVARKWIEHLVAAIRKHDRRHLITVGLVPWSLDRPGLNSGFVPREIAEPLDLVCVHIYPEGSKINEALETLSGFAVGKPVVVEEMFPLKCSVEELDEFIRRSEGTACGWIGFYWGKTVEECRTSKSFADAFMYAWLKFFQSQAPTKK